LQKRKGRRATALGEEGRKNAARPYETGESRLPEADYKDNRVKKLGRCRGGPNVDPAGKGDGKLFLQRGARSRFEWRSFLRERTRSSHADGRRKGRDVQMNLKGEGKTREVRYHGAFGNLYANRPSFRKAVTPSPERTETVGGRTPHPVSGVPYVSRAH